jgi:hypothetical protein
MNKEKLELFEQYEKLGGTLGISTLEKKSEDYLQNLILCEKAKNKDTNTLIEEYENIDLSSEDKLYTSEQLEKMSNFDIQAGILREKAYLRELSAADNFSITDITRQDDDFSVSHDLGKFRQLSNDINDTDTEDEINLKKNIIIKYENLLREDIGLEPKPLLLTNEQLNIAISLDKNSFGDTCKELLTNYESDKYSYDKLKYKLNEMVALKQQIEQREQKEILFMSEVTQEYDALKNLNPKKLIKKDNGYVVTKEFQNWIKDLKALDQKLDTKLRTMKSIESDEKLDVTYDKRGSIYKISENVKKMLEKEN